MEFSSQETEVASAAPSGLTLDQLPYLCLVNICNFLPAEDTARLSCVCKAFNDAASSEGIWRRYSLERWAFCDISVITGDSSRWYRYYRAKRTIEKKMDTGRPTRDYKVKSLRNHKADITSAVCLNRTDINWETVSHPLLVTLSTDSVLHVWNISEGKLLFTVSDRPVSCVAASDTINSIIAVGDRGGTVTIYSINDWSITGTVSDTDGASVADVSIYRMTSSLDLLIAVFIPEDRDDFINIWDINKLDEILITLSFPSLSMPKLTLSTGQYMAVNSDNSNDVLVWCLTDLMKTKSPDPHVTVHRQSTGPLVWFNTDTLMTAASTGFIPMLPGWVPGFRRMNYQSLTGEIELWNVGKHYKDSKKPTSNVYKVSHMYMPNSSMKLSSSVAGPVTQLVLINGRILTTSGATLSVVDASNGDTVESFTDHKDTITDIYADSYRVLTCSKDYSIRVYRWSNNTLISLYQLLGGSIAHKTHDGFHKVLCSSGTCIGVAGNIIKLYNFNENIKSS